MRRLHAPFCLQCLFVVVILLYASATRVAGAAEPGDDVPLFVDFTGIAPASSVCESRQLFEQRQHASIKAWATVGGDLNEHGTWDPLLEWSDWVDRGDSMKPNGTAKGAINYQAMAKLWMLENVTEPEWSEEWDMPWAPSTVEFAINDFIINDANIYALSGSDQHQDQYIFYCHRCGDYDFFTTSLLPIYFLFGDLLIPEAKNRIIDAHPSESPCPNPYCPCREPDSCNHCQNTTDDLVYFTGDPGSEQTFSIQCDDYLPCIYAYAALITFVFGPQIWTLEPTQIFAVVSSSALANVVFAPWCKDERSIEMYDSENHVMMQATARYLANMVRGESNDYFDWWWLNNPSEMGNATSYTFFNLSDSLREDFREYNAHPYQTFTVLTLHNLYNFAPEASSTKLASHIVLDYISERFAMQSTDLRRNVPWRRHAKQRILKDPDVFNGDPTSSWFAVLAGNYHGMEQGGVIHWTEAGSTEALLEGNTRGGKGTLMASLSAYRIPDPILDVIIDKENNPYFYVARPMHSTVEIGYFERNFAILGGGTTWDAPDPELPHGIDSGVFSREKDGMAQSTRVLFRGSGRMREDDSELGIEHAGFEIYHPDMDDMMKIPFGHDDAAMAFERINNTCVFENFACGTEITWGSLLEPCIQETRIVPGTGETWTFFDITGSADGCPDFGCFAAVLQRGTSVSLPEIFPDAGFLEIVAAEEFDSSFDSFVTAASSGLNPHGYRTTRGTSLQFDPFMTDNSRWAIQSVTYADGSRFDPGRLCGHHLVSDIGDFSQWPFIYSHRMTTDDRGVVTGRDTSDFLHCADGTGQVLFNNTNRQESVILSLADPGEPVRLVQSCPARDVAGYGEPNPRTVSLYPTPGRGVGYVSILWAPTSAPTSVDLEFTSPLWTYRTTRTVTNASMEEPFRTDHVLPHDMRGIPFQQLDIVPHPSDAYIQAVEVYEYCEPRDPDTGGDCDLDGVRDAWEPTECLDPSMVPGPEHPDTDGDGVIDECDVCPAGYNPDQSEFPDIHSWDDQELFLPGLLCSSDVHPHPRSVDLDCDDQPNGCDPCPRVPGPEDGTWVDLDDDAVPDDYCDNCAGNVSNPDQANCDEAYDSSSPLFPGGNPGTYRSTDAGDACDPDPCMQVTSVDSYGPGCLALDTPSGGGIGGVAETINATYVGFAGPLGTEASPSTRNILVDHAFCDCSSLPRVEDCYLPEPDGYFCSMGEPLQKGMNSGPRWHYLELLDEVPEHPDDIPVEQHRGPVAREFKQFGHAGSDTDITWDVLGEEEYTEDCDMIDSAYSRCDPFRYYLYFEPRVDEWDEYERKKVFWPSIPDYPPFDPKYIGEKTCTVLPPGMRRFFPPLDAEKRATIPGRDNGPGPGRYEPPIREVISYWEFTDPPPFDEFLYPDTKDSSRVIGMTVHALDANTGLVRDQYDVQFAGVSEILDTSWFSSVAFSMPVPQHDTLQAGQLPDATDHVLIFGGLDLDGYRNDLWIGTIHPAAGEERPVLEFSMLSPDPSEEAPSPRAGSALFHDRSRNRVVLWGGWNDSGTLDDLWYLDLQTLLWNKGEALGESPPGQMLFASEFATMPIIAYDDPQGGSARMFRETGYIFGGVSAEGTYQRKLWVLDLGTGWFREVTWGKEGPPGLAGAAVDVDPPSGRVFLFGGYDENRIHNWLWSMDLTTENWSMISDDCYMGMCPNMSGNPAMAAGRDHMVTIVPGKTADPAIDEYMEPAFTFTGTGQWRGIRELAGHPLSGDCDGDDVTDEGFGTLCTVTDRWWSPPGSTRCDAMGRTTYCDQWIAPEVSTTSRYVPGLATFRVEGTVMYMLQDDRLVSVDVSDPVSPRSLDDLCLGGRGRDMEIYDHTAVVAADAGLIFVALGEDGSMSEVRRVSTCGRAVSVAHDSRDAYFLTPVGFGKVSLRSDGTVPDSFSILWPQSHGDWVLAPVPEEHCEELSSLAETICTFFKCPGDGYRPLVVNHDRAWFPVLRKLFTVDLSLEPPEIISYIRTPGMIVDMRKKGRFLYARYKHGYYGLAYDVLGPQIPIPVVWQDVGDWIGGMHYSGGNAFRQEGSSIQVAIGGAP